MCALEQRLLGDQQGVYPAIIVFRCTLIEEASKQTKMGKEEVYRG